MGLIKAAVNAAGGALADQWLEYFYCDSIDQDVLVTKGKKQTGKRSSNTRGNDNVISNGSGIVVADGQCMVIVENGKIVEACAEPGQYTFQSDVSPSLFAGNFTEGLSEAFDMIAKRFSHGGIAGVDQRVYYFNIKEIMDNKFGTAQPVPFRVVDKNIGLDIDVSLRCNGVYSYRIINPLLFYANVCGNVEEEYTRDEIAKQLKTEFISALQPAFSRISELEIRPNALPGHTEELAAAMNEALDEKWKKLRGISVISVAINSISLAEEDMELIRQAQKVSMMRNPAMAAATLVEAQAEAMKNAASNANGAMAGFMGMNMAVQSGGSQAQNLFQMAEQQMAYQQMNSQQLTGGQVIQQQAQGDPQWVCKCGMKNTGKFCMECGARRPESAPSYRCSNCGWTPQDPKKPPKFCPECGNPFDANDIVAR